jgi:hypothetical protein
MCVRVDDDRPLALTVGCTFGFETPLPVFGGAPGGAVGSRSPGARRTLGDRRRPSLLHRPVRQPLRTGHNRRGPVTNRLVDVALITSFGAVTLTQFEVRAA